MKTLNNISMYTLSLDIFKSFFLYTIKVWNKKITTLLVASCFSWIFFLILFSCYLLHRNVSLLFSFIQLKYLFYSVTNVIIILLSGKCEIKKRKNIGRLESSSPHLTRVVFVEASTLGKISYKIRAIISVVSWRL